MKESHNFIELRLPKSRKVQFDNHGYSLQLLNNINSTVTIACGHSWLHSYSCITV